MRTIALHLCIYVQWRTCAFNVELCTQMGDSYTMNDKFERKKHIRHVDVHCTSVQVFSTYEQTPFQPDFALGIKRVTVFFCIYRIQFPKKYVLSSCLFNVRSGFLERKKFAAVFFFVLPSLPSLSISRGLQHQHVRDTFKHLQCVLVREPTLSSLLNHPRDLCCPKKETSAFFLLLLSLSLHFDVEDVSYFYCSRNNSISVLVVAACIFRFLFSLSIFMRECEH